MRKIQLIGVIGLLIGLVVFMMGLITPLPAIPVCGLGVGIMTLSTLSPVFDFSKPRVILTISTTLVYLLGIMMVFIGLLSPVGMLPVGIIGIVIVIISFATLVIKARRKASS